MASQDQPIEVGEAREGEATTRSQQQCTLGMKIALGLEPVREAGAKLSGRRRGPIGGPAASV